MLNNPVSTFAGFHQSPLGGDLGELLKQAIETANVHLLVKILEKNQSLVNNQFNGYTPLYLALKKVQDNTDDAKKYTLTRFVLTILEFNPQENQNVVQLLEELFKSSDDETRKFALIVQALHLGKKVSIGLYFAQQQFILSNDALLQLAQEKIQKNSHVINDVVTINNYDYLLLSQYCHDDPLNQRILDVMLALKPTKNTLDWALRDCITSFNPNIMSIEKLVDAGANINQGMSYGFATPLDHINSEIARIKSYSKPEIFDTTLKKLGEIKSFFEQKGAKYGSQIFAREIKVSNFLNIDRPTDQASVVDFEKEFRDILNLDITSFELALILRKLVDVGMLVSKKALEDQIKKHPDVVSVLLEGEDSTGNKISYTILDYLDHGLKRVQEFLNSSPQNQQDIKGAEDFKKNCEQIQELLLVVSGSSSSSQPISGLQKSLSDLKDKLLVLKSKLEELKASLGKLKEKFVS